MSPLHAPLKIDIPATNDEIDASTRSLSPSAELRERLERTPQLSPEAYAQREMAALKLADLHKDARRARARAINERASEGVARRLRLEEEAAERAANKMVTALEHADARRQAMSLRRKEEVARREALCAAVREAKEARQASRSPRPRLETPALPAPPRRSAISARPACF